MSKNTSGGVPESPAMSSPESSTGCMSPPGGGGAKLTPAPAGLVSQIPGQQGKFAGYGMGLHGPVHGAGQPGGDQYTPKPAAPAHQGSWGARPGSTYNPQGPGWGPASAADNMGARRPSYAANPVPRVTVTDNSPTRPAPGRLGDGSSSSASPAENCYKAFRVELGHLHRRVLGMHEAMDRQSDLPQRFVAAIQVDLVQMIKTIEVLPANVYTMSKMLKEIDQELQNVKVLFVQQNLDNETTHNRDQNRIVELQDKVRELMDQNVDYQAKIGSLNMQRSADQEKIRRLQEQVDGKRNLWMQMHPEPQERALALAYHGGAKPTASSYGASNTLNQESAAATSTNWRPQSSAQPGHQKTPSLARSISTPLKAENRFQEPRFAPARHAPGPGPDTTFRRDAAGPKAPLTASNVATYLGDMTVSAPEGMQTKAEAGTPLKLGATPKSRALEADLKLAAKAPVQFWQDSLRKLWALSLGFCNRYISADHIADLPAFVQGKAPRVWDNIATSLFPRDPKARDQAWQTISELLRDTPSRTFLAQRLIIQHILRDIFRPSGWLGFDMAIDEEFQRIQKQLDENASFKPHERASILERRAVVVLTMLDDARWDQFRHTKVNEHFQALKQSIWALAPDEKTRTEMHEAGHFDLFSLLELAWELATKMYLSRADFYFSWPDVGEKFTADTHADLAVDHPGILLEPARFGRIRVAVTPGVTMRKPEGMRIVPKGILKANVLVG